MHRLADHNEDYAPFQIDWVGVQAKQLQREGNRLPEPPVGWRNPLLWLQAPRPFRASPRTSLKSHWPSRSPPPDLSDVPLAGKDTASKSLEVTLAQKDNRPRAPDQAEDSSSPIVSSLRNKYFETSHCFGLSITPPLGHSKSDRTIG